MSNESGIRLLLLGGFVGVVAGLCIGSLIGVVATGPAAVLIAAAAGLAVGFLGLAGTWVFLNDNGSEG